MAGMSQEKTQCWEVSRERGTSGEGQKLGEETGARWGWEGGDSGGSGATNTLSSLPGFAQTLTSKTTSAGLSRPIQTVEAYSQARELTLRYPQRTLELSPAGNGCIGKFFLLLF